MNPINQKIKKLIDEGLKKSMSYPQYRDFVTRLVAKESTSGALKTDELIYYTRLNDRRMRRWDKTIKISKAHEDQIKSFAKPSTWLVLTESWCGDAAHLIPVINKVAQLNPNIDLHIVLRDEHLMLMDAFLTHQARAIPKLIMIDNTTKEVRHAYGPRPSIATQMVDDYKTKHKKLTPEFKENLQVWYNKNKGQNTIEDLVNLL
jgi:thiol-disulfide isomerase/thioredoxin